MKHLCFKHKIFLVLFCQLTSLGIANFVAIQAMGYEERVNCDKPLGVQNFVPPQQLMSGGSGGQLPVQRFTPMQVATGDACNQSIRKIIQNTMGKELKYYRWTEAIALCTVPIPESFNADERGVFSAMQHKLLQGFVTSNAEDNYPAGSTFGYQGEESHPESCTGVLSYCAKNPSSVCDEADLKERMGEMKVFLFERREAWDEFFKYCQNLRAGQYPEGFQEKLEDSFYRILSDDLKQKIDVLGSGVPMRTKRKLLNLAIAGPKNFDAANLDNSSFATDNLRAANDTLGLDSTEKPNDFNAADSQQFLEMIKQKIKDKGDPEMLERVTDAIDVLKDEPEFKTFADEFKKLKKQCELGDLLEPHSKKFWFCVIGLPAIALTSLVVVGGEYLLHRYKPNFWYKLKCKLFRVHQLTVPDVE